MLGRVLSDILGRKEQQPQPAPSPDNPLLEYFFRNQGRQIEKWHHYLDIYHRHFASFRGRSPVVVEIGVQHGGSLEMWRHYFGAGVQLVGIDKDERCRQFDGDSTTIMIGDQGDRGFLREVRARVPRIDILIDDGGHTMEQQIATFEELYSHVQSRGVYLCEDVHTSYLPNFGGGRGKDTTFVSHMVKVVDQMHAWYSDDTERFAVDGITRSTYAVHFYDSIVVIEKRPIEEPRVSKRGKPSF